jgi:O-antigen ligase
MIPDGLRQYSANLIMAAGFLGTTFMIPSIAYDPINAPKLLVIGTFGVLALVMLLLFHKAFKIELKDKIFLICVLMILDLTIILFTKNRIEDQFFGAYGRNTGFLAIISLIGLFFLTRQIIDRALLSRIESIFLVTGLISLVYGLLQVFNLDPVKWAPSGYTRIFGFLGNPNFESAFMGMFASACLAILISGKVSARKAVITLSLIISALFVIWSSESTQGYLVFLVGAASVVAIRIQVIGNQTLKIVWYLITFIASVGVLLGMLQKGPLSQFLYKDSVTFRGDYWRAAWSMATSNPFNGVGIDNFGENYRSFRDMEATLRRGANVTSNSPHNVFLDFLVNGGFILFGLYAALVLVTLFVSMKVIRLSKTYSPTYASIFGVWMGYLAQSFISVNQLGLAVWGWILMGALLGMNSQGSLDQQDAGNSNSKKRIKVDSNSSPAVIIVGFLGILLGMVLSIWPIKNSIDYASSLRSGDADRLMSNALQVPIQAERLFDISVIFSNNNLEAQSVELLRKAIILYPNKFEIWQALSVMTTATPAEKTQALAQMKRLDPYNPDLK